jgi:hypothetical protein
MADLKTLIEDNKKERERLLALMAGLKEQDFRRRLPNGWSVSVALAHLAFWDFYQATALQRWAAKGQMPPALEALAVNEPLSLLSEAIPSATVTNFTKAAAEMSDKEVEKLTPAQAEEFFKIGRERFLHRAQHRREHLDKIVKFLESVKAKG